MTMAVCYDTLLADRLRLLTLLVNRRIRQPPLAILDRAPDATSRRVRSVPSMVTDLPNPVHTAQEKSAAHWGVLNEAMDCSSV
jgi:hypothetical protein